MSQPLTPNDLGFTPVIRIHPHESVAMQKLHSTATSAHVVYCITCQDRVIRVGMTTNPMWNRAADFRRVMHPGLKKRPHEERYGERMWRMTNGEPFTFWSKPALSSIHIGGPFNMDMSGLGLEERSWPGTTIAR